MVETGQASLICPFGTTDWSDGVAREARRSSADARPAGWGGNGPQLQEPMGQAGQATFWFAALDAVAGIGWR
jgi:hypothetical protein